MLLVGLTGNIASGKSTVAQLFAGWGGTLIDADVLARQAVNVGMPAYHAIVERWGEGVTSPDGPIDRRVLRQRVFSDSRAARGAQRDRAPGGPAVARPARR